MENNVFRLNSNNDNVICPPEQVFENSQLEFLITVGGNLSEEYEFDSLMSFLQEIGESKILIHENLGATQTDRSEPYRLELSTSTSWNEYKIAMSEIDPNFGLLLHHYFAFGSRKDWGIYISEFPTVNIIGCSNSLAENFRKIFNISANGFKQTEDLIYKEFESYPVLLTQFKSNYNLD